MRARWIWVVAALGGAACGPEEQASAPAAPGEAAATLTPVVDPEPPPPSYEVHEWGLITTRLGEATGLVVGGPGRFAPPPARRPTVPIVTGMNLTIRKPVLYVHLADGVDELVFSATVSVPGGTIREHWPPVAAATPGERSAVRWEAVTARRGVCAAREYPCADEPPCTDAPDGYCEVAELEGYETEDGACLSFEGRDYDHLFYRASRPVTLPVEVRRDGADLVVGGRPAGKILHLRRGDRRDRTRVRAVELPPDGATVSIDAALANGDPADVGVAMLEGELASLGLTADERTAFRRAWDTHLFGPEAGAAEPEPLQEGRAPGALTPPRAALLYFLPGDGLDAVAHLELDPAPAAVRRALAVLVDVGGVMGAPRSDPHPSATRPRAQVTVGRPTVRGSMPVEIARRVIRREHAAIRRCAEAEEQRRGVAPRGELQMGILVRPSGEIAAVRQTTNRTGSTTLAACVAARLRTLRFPATGAGVTHVEQPIRF